VREAEANINAIDTTTRNMHMLREAIKEAGVLWRNVAGLAHAPVDNLATEFALLDMKCMETQNGLVGLVSKYDRFLNLVCPFRPGVFALGIQAHHAVARRDHKRAHGRRDEIHR
jgi:hypothetical protein